MKRYECLEVINEYLTERDLVVTSLGGLVDEWYNVRPSDANLYQMQLGTVGPIALGLAIARPNRQVVCLNTDGSLLMNTGGLCTMGNERPENLLMYVFDNECYECIGGPPTHTEENVDLAKMASGAGVPNVDIVSTLDELEIETERAVQRNELTVVVCKIEPGVKEFPEDERLETDGFEDTYAFLRHIEETEDEVIKPPAEYN